MLEFDSNRKCMSVIVEDSEGRKKLITKGAESSVLPKCIHGPTRVTQKHIDDYALIGLRTLAIAYKDIGQREYEQFLQE